jgi:plastocyanin
VHVVPQPHGPAVVSSPSTVTTSGIIGPRVLGFSDTYQYSFPNAGRFDYMCRVHDHMVGLVVAGG